MSKATPVLAACLLLIVSACSSKAPSTSASTAASAWPAGMEAPERLWKLSGSLEPLPGLQVQRYSLHNGLTLYLVPQPGSGVVSYVTSYNVGSRFESEGRTGLAHLFEHMMFRGTPSFPNPFQTLSDWGESFNATTDFDMTQYYEKVPKAYFADVVKFEAERMRHLALTPEAFKTERGAVVSERKNTVEDQPFARMYWELFQLAYKTHPYRVEPIGWQEDLDATTFQDALDFYARFYAPNRAVIVIAGDFDVANALQLTGGAYGLFKKENSPEPKVPQEKFGSERRRRVIGMKTENVMIADATWGLSIKSPLRTIAAESLMCSLLADDKQGYLYYQLVDKGLARRVSSSCGPLVDPGLSTLFLVALPGVSAEKLEGAYAAALPGFLKWAAAQDRLEKMKLYYQSSHWGELRDPMNLAKDIAENHLQGGDPLLSFKFIEEMKKVTMADIRARFEARLKSGGARVIVRPASKTLPLKKPVAKK